jgi:hypothetical protein
MEHKKASVIIPTNLSSPLEDHEVEVAWILAYHYNDVIEFLRPVDGYRIKTADIVMNGVMYEIKSPIGHSKTTISRQIERAAKQSKYIVLDGRRTAISDTEIENKIRFVLSVRQSVQKVIFITKQQTVVEILSKR